MDRSASSAAVGAEWRGPVKGLRQLVPLSQEARLAGRPRLCSDCGLCDSSLKPRMAQACPFVRTQMVPLEYALHGRARHEGDELRFGIFSALHVARLRRPVPGAQWSGMVTTLAARLLEQQQVEAVLLAGTAPGTRFAPQPRLARTPAEVYACAGNKPCLSPHLALLDPVRAAGVRRLAVIGTGCQVQALRAVAADLGLERLDVIGIPCSDNVTYPDLQRFLRLVSRAPETVVHYEFMQDYRLWLRHEDGRRERVNFIDFPMDRLEDVFPAACLACFDYPNALADVTIGYMGAPLGWQWVLVRTARGAELFELLVPELEFGPLVSGGDRARGMPRYVRQLGQPPARPPLLIRRMIAFLQRQRGPRGLEFARAVIEMKWLRNLHYVRSQFSRLESRIVPEYVYRALAPYADAYARSCGRSLSPADSP